MLTLALSIGFFGSLHCAGMCGPLALVFCSHQTGKGSILPGVFYNIGRVITYMILGLVFGLIGSVFAMANIQMLVSVVLGVIMIFSFFLSIDLDRAIAASWLGRKVYQPVKLQLGYFLSRASSKPPILLGMLNGILPCGMVYIALAGAMSMPGIENAAIFMMFFGLGTFPMMMIFSSGIQWVRPSWRLRFQKILPYVTLLFGCALIYRGISTHIPEELNFWQMLKNPIMCH
jgi:sulfite exporter TauE/SafE